MSLKVLGLDLDFLCRDLKDDFNFHLNDFRLDKPLKKCNSVWTCLLYISDFALPLTELIFVLELPLQVLKVDLGLEKITSQQLWQLVASQV